MIRAYVNERGIVLQFDSLADKLPTPEMEALLDELKSHYIPSFYQYGKRCYVDFFGGGKPRIVIYFTSETVAMDEAIRILKKRNNIEVHDVRGAGPAAS